MVSTCSVNGIMQVLPVLSSTLPRLPTCTGTTSIPHSSGPPAPEDAPQPAAASAERGPQQAEVAPPLHRAGGGVSFGVDGLIIRLPLRLSIDIVVYVGIGAGIGSMIMRIGVGSDISGWHASLL